MSTETVKESAPASPAPNQVAADTTGATVQSSEPVSLTGRSVFVVQTAAEGVMVRSAFLTEDKRLVDMPAIFPELTYALNVVEDLKRQITEQFAQAARIGARVIAEQSLAQQTALEANEKTDGDKLSKPDQTVPHEDLSDERSAGLFPSEGLKH